MHFAWTPKGPLQDSIHEFLSVLPPYDSSVRTLKHKSLKPIKFSSSIIIFNYETGDSETISDLNDLR